MGAAQEPSGPSRPATPTLVSTTLGLAAGQPSRCARSGRSRSARRPSSCASARASTATTQDEFALRSHQAAAAAWDAGFYDDLDGRGPRRRPGSRRVDPRRHVAGEAGRAQAVVPPRRHGHRGQRLPAQRRRLRRPPRQRRAPRARSACSPLARIAGRAATALDPQFFGFAPVEAANLALRRAGIGWSDVGAVELNEAFAAQSLACVRAWDVDPAIVNTKGGAIAIGHPLGASGTRILGTLARVLEESGQRWGVAAICIGVGQGLAVVLENVAS